MKDFVMWFFGALTTMVENFSVYDDGIELTMESEKLKEFIPYLQMKER
jgi:hypothetical protein